MQASTFPPNGASVSPITLGIWWNRLISIADEAAAALLRSAFSTIIRESNDYAIVLTDPGGDTIAECQAGIPAFAAVLGVLVRRILQQRPAAQWSAGDVLITNDPWLATGHLPDIAVITPIVHQSTVVGFAASAAHAPDIGASNTMGASELMAEGVLIPPLLLERGGHRNAEVLDLLLHNVRVPEQVLGDLEAQISANSVCRRRAVEFLDDVGLDGFDAVGAALQGRAEAVMRKAIRALPDGRYHSKIESDGVPGAPTTIRCAITVDGDRLTIDYDGTSPQVRFPINCTLNYTMAYSVYPLKILLDPFTRRNGGSYRAISVQAPRGSIVNAAYPAPVMARHLTGHLLSCAIYQALAPVLPDRVLADSGGSPALRVRFLGENEDRSSFVLHLFASAGMGASSRGDGLSTTAFPTNSGAGSVEALESGSPLIFTRKEYRQDSGGAGAFRGGLGQVVELLNPTDRPVRVVLVGDRERHPAQGVLGGLGGATARAEFEDGIPASLKSSNELRAGGKITIAFAGGGGYGSPLDRSRPAVVRDLEDGLISPEAARDVYGLEEQQRGRELQGLG